MNQSSLKTKGFLTIEELKSLGKYPTEEVFEKGPIAVIECIEEIPCNPCEQNCIKGAIKIGHPITNLPQINLKVCTGCSFCLSHCPGLAIYIKDYTYTEERALISFPYEFLPLPNEGQKVMAVNREGREVCEGIIIKVNNNKKYDHTTIISMTYPKTYFHEVVSMKRIKNTR